MLTARQEQVLEFIRLHIKQHGYPPTRSEICIGFGWKSHNAAESKLRELERKGKITMIPGISRGIKIK